MNIGDRTSEIALGDDVRATSGEKLGKVAGVFPEYIVVEKGFFFPTDYYIPRANLQTLGDGQISLTVSTDAAMGSGWDRLPDDLQAGVPETVSAPNTSTSVTSSLLEQGESEGERRDGTGYIVRDGEILIPLLAEELTATVRQIEGGVARVSKRIVTEDRVIDVPIAEDLIRVERRLIDRSIDPSNTVPYEEIVIEIPLRSEEVELQKQARVVEEIVVTRQMMQRVEQVSGTVRREEVVIDDHPRRDEENS